MTSTAVATRAPDPEYDRLARVGQWLSFAEGKPNDGPAAALRLYYARELGLPPFAAAELSIIAGRLVVSSALLRALAQKAGYDVRRVEESPEHCVVALIDRATGEELGRSAFSMTDAKRAGLVKERSAWMTYPGRMLFARASKNAVYDYAPAVALGMITEDEADEITALRVGAVEVERVEAEPITQAERDEAIADEAREPSGASVPPAPDTFDSYEAETEWKRAQRADELRRVHRDLALLIRDVETEGKQPPAGHDSWTDYSRWLAQERWNVESRSELEADQVQALIEEVDRAAGLPS